MSTGALHGPGSRPAPRTAALDTALHTAPDVLPVLSAGRHRSPRGGACFMEVASFLAGERWSDHPSCTDPLLATAARCVNDRTSDAARPRLGALVPDVVGLTSDDPRLAPLLVRAAAAHALPVAAEPRQRVLAVAVLTCDGVLAELDGRDEDHLEPETEAALRRAPGAQRWARRFVEENRPRRRGRPSARARDFARRSAPQLVALAVGALADTGRPDVDDRLHALLVDLVALGRAHASPAVRGPGSPAARLTAERWAAAVALTGAR
ncbi:hypothetical protein ACUN7V_11095 [Quadrisphaera oryzae]|uniref:hypothetical protein n=1 Tax=Quadrisphaera TaxID=317661 RepID=UPI001645095E|nr:hypothetical protein [Quadrisphaera sp. RL12-1S]MBC3762153.1 hypothetical protein [Quadrisphaera sp. RL12-1S]